VRRAAHYRRSEGIDDTADACSSDAKCTHRARLDNAVESAII
jgi:hypothetical protein